MKIESPAFQYGKEISKKYTCDGPNINPPLVISDVPENSKSLTLVVNDPDAPSGNWIHWIMWNIDPKTTEIKENSVPERAMVGKSSFGDTFYGGPCPPPGTHHYFFKLYALDTKLDLPAGAKLSELEKSIEGHIIDKAEFMCVYNRGSLGIGFDR